MAAQQIRDDAEGVASSSDAPQEGMFEALFREIVTGKLAGGERLMIDEIAERFGVSKIPVREALKALEAKGWVESAPRRGTYVRALSLSELHELFELRMIVEPETTALAAHRRRTVHLQQLAALIEESEAAIKVNDFVTSSRVNLEFHSVIAQAAGNQLAYDVIHDLELRLARYFFESEWNERSETAHEHLAIYEAIRDQRAEDAATTTRNHLRHTEAMAARSIKDGKSNLKVESSVRPRGK
jgi:DNA-binding GntR family transcriptional regulator